MNPQSMVNQLLMDTAQAIIPSRDEIIEQTAISNEIKLLLESRSQYCIPKTKIAGSIGKATTIISSDVDMVVFIGIVHLPRFENVLVEFESLLRNWSRYAVKNLRRTQYAVQFTVNTYNFDLLAAIDFVHEANVGSDQQLILQQQRTLDKMKEDLQRNIYRFSSSLAFSTVKFMKMQTAATHDLARLAKFWYKSACIEEYVSGAKYAMEIIAVKACHGLRMSFYNENFHMLAFQKFLEDVMYFDSLDIIFEEEYRSLNGHLPPRNRVKPSVLDPANPYNNLAESFMRKPKAINALKLHAERTLKNIHGLQWDDGRLNVSNFTFWRVIDIFKPDLLDGMGRVAIDAFALGNRIAPMEVRIAMNDVLRKKIDFMQICLTAICKKAPGDLNGRLELVYKIKHPFANFVPVPFIKHEDYNATICLGIGDNANILFSFDASA